MEDGDAWEAVLVAAHLVLVVLLEPKGSEAAYVRTHVRAHVDMALTRWASVQTRSQPPLRTYAREKLRTHISQARC